MEKAPLRAKPFICMEAELFGKTTKLFLMNHESFYSKSQGFGFPLIEDDWKAPKPKVFLFSNFRYRWHSRQCP